MVRVLIFFVVRCFCCLGFSGVIVFLFGLVRVFFCCLGGGPGPAQTAKQTKKSPRPNSKNKKAPAPSERVFFLCCCLGGWMCLYFLFGRGACFFLLFGRVACLFFAVWAGVCSFFAVWAGARSFCLLFGPGACFCFAVWVGDGSSLTYPSAWLVFKRPNNKRDRTAKKKTGSETWCSVSLSWLQATAH